MATCPECGAKVRRDNLKAHVEKVHKKTDRAEEEGAEEGSRTVRRRGKVERKVSPWPAVGLAVVLAVSSVGAYWYLTQSSRSSGGGGGQQSHGNPVAVIDVNNGTYYGTFRIELRIDVAPKTVNNFVNLANRGFYNGLTFHRISSNPHVIQGGAGGSVPSIPWESTGLKNVAYSVAMARAQSPDSATSQFYINTADNLYLDSGQYPYVVFGIVTDGRDVVDVLSRVPVDGETPREPVVMTSVRIIY